VARLWNRLLDQKPRLQLDRLAVLQAQCPQYYLTCGALLLVAQSLRYKGYRGPISVQDVLHSRMIADPLHLLDCCVVSDGGGAVLVTTEERARDLKQSPVYVLGSSESHTHAHISQMPDLTVTAAAITAPRAFAEAGITPGSPRQVTGAKLAVAHGSGGLLSSQATTILGR
jgi:thiolase-like protein